MKHIIPQLHNRDWFSRILSRLKLHPALLFIFLSFVSLTSNILFASKFDAILPNAKNQGLLAEPSAFFIDGLIQPLFIAYFYWLQRSMPGLFHKLVEEGSLKENSNTRDGLNVCQHRLQNLWLGRGALIFSVLFCTVFLLTFSQVFLKASYPSWITTSPVLVWSRIPFVFLASYVVFIGCIDLVIISLTVNKVLIEENIKIQPFHPDKAGGMNPLGRFISSIGLIIGAIGLTLSVIILQSPVESFFNDYMLIVVLIIYLLIGPILFFAPLAKTHKTMVVYADKYKKEISIEYDKVLSAARKNISKDMNRNDELQKRLSYLMELRSSVDEFPTWPVNASTLRNFFSLILSPLLISIGIEIFVKIVIG